MHTSYRTALVTGLTYAQLIEAHFPDVYLSLAGHTVSWRILYGISGMFLTLAHQKLLALDFASLAGEGMSLAIKPSNPEWAMGFGQSSEVARHRLLVFSHWLTYPVPKVYGLGRDLHRLMPLRWPETRDVSCHALAMLLWQLVRGGPWEVARSDDIQTFAAWLPNETMGTGIRLQSAISPDTPLAQLCARLDRDRPCGLNHLGSILAYSCGKTANPYADWSTVEIRQQYDMAVDLDWRRSPSVFAEERQLQQQAKNLAAAYRRIDRQLYHSPDLILQIGQALRTTAGELLRDTTPGYCYDAPYDKPYDPTRLVNILEEL